MLYSSCSYGSTKEISKAVSDGKVRQRLDPGLPRQRPRKKWKTYDAFTVAGYIGDQRRRWTFAALKDALAEAKELADSIANGPAELLGWPSSFRLEVVEAIKVATDAGVGLLPGIKLLQQALQILGSPDELLFACQMRRELSPNRKIIPQPVETAVDAFLARQKSRLSENRYRTDFGYLSAFKTKFAGRKQHAITTNAVSAHVDAKLASKDWGKRTKNDWRNSVDGMFEWAIKQSWAATNPTSSSAIKREKLKSGPHRHFHAARSTQDSGSGGRRSEGFASNTR